jgi:alginate O-acetyltransferase complex protein AlgI
MLFNANEFILVFLPVAFLLFHLIRHYSVMAALNFLTLASLVFYGYGEPSFILLLLFSVTCNYFLGCHLIEHKNSRVLFAGILGNVIAIGYFKYTNFLIGSFNDLLATGITLKDIALPLGISFYTFQKIAFLVDAYKSKIQKPAFMEYLLFVSFFPQLIAGPIVHYNQIAAQIRDTAAIPARLVTAGIFLYCIGLVKKSVFADFVGVWADIVFDNPAGDIVNAGRAWMGVMAYTLQIYFDFSGYTDMALGLGMMFGIVLPINFNSPYKSGSIVEFWRRWHISLSSWLRDYVYIPLGGRGQSELVRAGNLMATMLVGGLWHGAAWTFVVWGGLHGLALSCNHVWSKVRPVQLVEGASISGRVYRLASWALTFMFVSLTWIVFRANTFQDVASIFQKLSWGLGDTLAFSMPDMALYFAQDTQSFAAWLFMQDGCFLLNMTILATLVGITCATPNSLWWKDHFRPNLLTSLFCATAVLTVVAANIFLVTPNAFIYFRF